MCVGVFAVAQCFRRGSLLVFVFEWSLCGVVFVSWCGYGVLLKVMIWWMNTR